MERLKLSFYVIVENFPFKNVEKNSLMRNIPPNTND